MNPTSLRGTFVTALFLSVCTLPQLRAQGTPIGFEETFALAPDRSKVLDQLLPGTEDHYYYRCLDAQQRGDFATSEGLLKLWVTQLGSSSRYEDMALRQALLTYERDPAATYDYLRKLLGLRFDAKRTAPGSRPDLPTTLDPALLSTEALDKMARERHPNTVDGYRDTALSTLAASGLSGDLLTSLLRRLSRPDVPGLVTMLARQMRQRDGVPYGGMAIHRALTLAQYDEWARLVPELLGNSTFVSDYAARLRPNADIDWRRDSAARVAYFARLWAFAQRLPAAQNSFKIHVLHGWLAHDLAAGTLEKQRFLDYLRLPRPASYIPGPQREVWQQRGELGSFGATYSTLLSAVTGDEALVRQCLEHFFQTEESYEPYREWIAEEWLRRVFAEQKLLAGQGDATRLYTMLSDPAYYEQLKERVEIQFVPTQKTFFAADEAVSIDVDVKNVPTLLVKVFTIDAYAFHRDNGRDVDASIDLDGLVANRETTQEYTEPPLRRVRRRFDLPELQGPGTYVVELLGNGQSSRAVIVKGSLQFTQRLGAAGHVVTVRDAKGQPVPGGGVWFLQKDYTADKNGEVNLPFGENDATVPVVLHHGAISSLRMLAHRSERYELAAGVFVDREALTAGSSAKVLVRPQLRVNGEPITLQLLEQPELLITAMDQDGTPTTRTMRDLKLTANEEFSVEIQVPERLSSLSLALRGRVQSLVARKPVEVAATPANFSLNGIDATAMTAAPLLGRGSEGYFLDVLGKNGEPKAERPVVVHLTLRDYTDAVDVTLKTDAKGRVRLGELRGVTALEVLGLPGPANWTLQDRHTRLPERVTGKAGTTLRVPYPGTATAAERSELSLFEVADRSFVRDRFDALAVADGYVELRNLEAGDYELHFQSPDHTVAVSVTAGDVLGQWALGTARWLPDVDVVAPQIRSVEATGQALTIQLGKVSADARLHVWATRYLPAYAPQRIEVPQGLLLNMVEVQAAESDFRSGRQLSDEYRYILERRYAAKHPGNMLSRPGLLLNPWALAEVRGQSEAEGGAGGRFGSRGGRAAPKAGAASPAPASLAAEPMAAYGPNLDFLPLAAPMLPNLKADSNGQVTIRRSDLGQGQHVHVVLVDGAHTVYRSLALEEAPLQPRPRELRNGLDPKQHVTQQQRIEFVQAGGTAQIADVSTAKTEIYSSLSDVYRLFTALSHDADLAKFAFVLRWPQLSSEEQRKLYSEHACHELNLFLLRKDPKFFDSVIKPYLQAKLHKTFLDEWLLGMDVSRYLQPWAFDRLNIVEQILLLQRLPGQRESGARLLRERWELLPKDVELQNRLLMAALQSNALEQAPNLYSDVIPPGEFKRQEELLREESATRLKVKQAAADELMPMGGGGGGRGLVAGKPAGPTTGGPGGPAAPGAPRPGGGLGTGGPASPGAFAAQRAAAGERLAKDKDAAGLADAEKAKSGSDEFYMGERRKADEQADLDRRMEVAELYREVDPTRRYAETNYWRRRIGEQGAAMIAVNAFWADLAAAPEGAPFCSPHFAACTGSFAEMMLALALIDLPFVGDAPKLQRDGLQGTLRPTSPILLVRRELLPAQAAAAQSDVLLSQNYYRLDDRYRFENGERFDRFVTGEFVTDVVYGCQVVLTNPTSTPRKLELLLQIPRGALPVQNGFVTKGMPMVLDAYATSRIEYSFYFPAAGEFAHFPAHVAKDGVLIASAQVARDVLPVVAVPTEVDAKSWERVSQDGTADDVMAFLAQANLQRVDLSRVLWRLEDRAFFERMIGFLRSRHVWNETVSSYALLHGVESEAREWLRGNDVVTRRCAPGLRSPLLTLEPVERQWWELIEYSPLVHARAHQRGKRREILNRDLAQQYQSLMQVLAHEARLSDEQWLIAAYYLILQDRVEEATAAFARVRRDAVPAQLQYDYFACYLDLFSDEHARARTIATPYLDHPVARWRNLFGAVIAQLDEAEGKKPSGGDIADRGQRQGQLAAAQPMLEVALEGRSVVVQHKNLADCEVRYYRMDVEFSFSTNPFVQDGNGSYAWVQPQRKDALTLAADAVETKFALPAEFQSQNVLVEVRGGGLVRRQRAFASSLAVQTVDNYGQLIVTDANSKKPLPNVYVKVYARLPGGAVRFHKDGYTDLRGRFDYASISESATAGADKYALLVLGEQSGAVIKEVTPPQK